MTMLGPTTSPTGPAPAALASSRGAATRSVGKALGRSLGIAASTFVIVLVIWIAVVQFGGVSTYIAKGPWDVWEHLVTADDAAENRVEIFGLLGVTLRHSITGFVAGLAAAIVGAILFRLSRPIESTLMPLALLLRSVPLVAMAPVIILVFGFGTEVSVAVIGGIVVLFPALVNMVFGLRSASQQMLDVVHVYGGSSWTAVRKIALPAALPSLFAAIRISVPGAITGALLAEWLSTGDGIGRASQTYPAQARFDDLWAAVVVITVVALALYMLVQVIETVVLTRMGMNPDKRR